MLYKHKRGSRVCGSYVDLGWGTGTQKRPNVNGDGIFVVPDNAPEYVHRLLQSGGHIPVKAIEESLKKKAESKPQPKPEPKPKPVPVYKGYPEKLVEIKGVGPKTAKSIGSRLTTPVLLLKYDASHKRGPGSIAPGTWLKIVDFVKATWSE